MELSEYKNAFDLEPCVDAVEWLSNQQDLKTAWKECKRGDWMWWSLIHSGTDLPQSLCVGFANDCAERAINCVKKSKHAAYAAADAAAAAAYAAAAAAVDAAADAADDAYADAYAAYASAYAAAAAADDAYAAAADDAEKELQADWIRAHVECPFL